MAFISVCMPILLWSLLAVHGATVFAHEGKVVNGTQAQDGEYPFVVSLRRAASGRHSCGASMLNRGWVLTAAHCVSRSKPEAVNIQYGSNELDPNSTKVANVSQIYVHEEYQPEQQFINDIALLKLQAPIAFGAKVKAVRLPEMQQFTPGNASAVLLGWGQNAVSIRRTANKAHFCAGTTLSSVWILTAAHCFTYVNRPQDLSVQYGSSRLQATFAKYAHVTEIVKHEGYNPTVAIHDIALLRLAAAMELYNSLKAVELPKPLNGVSVAGGVMLLGWGLNETAGVLQNQLQKVQLKLLALPACRQQLQSFLHNTQLCAGAGSSTASKGQCSGDSGGPLLQQHTRTQIGIVSWSLKPCGSFPGVFTNVAEYTDWIMQKCH